MDAEENGGGSGLVQGLLIGCPIVLVLVVVGVLALSAAGIGLAVSVTGTTTDTHTEQTSGEATHEEGDEVESEAGVATEEAVEASETPEATPEH